MIAKLMAVAVALLILVPGAAAQAAAPAGSLSGSLTDDAQPVAGAEVALLVVPGNWYAGRATTDAAGAYRFPSVAPGTYTLQFKLPGGLIQFHPGVPDLASAGSINVLTGQDTNVAETVMPHGTIGGRITTDTGAPAPGARVELYGATDLSMRIRVIADAAGYYLIKYPPTGGSRLAVASGLRGGTNQWVRRQKDYNLADRFTVTPGRHTVVDERLLQAGLITGRFTAGGRPVPNVTVYGYSQSTTRESVSDWTDADGVFRLRPWPGSYKLKFTVPYEIGLDQWGGGAESEATTKPIVLAAGQSVVQDEVALPTAMLSGDLHEANGDPIKQGEVYITDPSHDRAIVQTTLNDGHWFKKVLPGTYTVRFNDGWGTQVQWATAQQTPQTADPITVAAGGEAVVNETLLTPGSLEVSAVDARSGAKLTTFCVNGDAAYTYFFGRCTADGTVELPRLSPGSYKLTVTSDGHSPLVQPGVGVTRGHLSTVTAQLSR